MAIGKIDVAAGDRPDARPVSRGGRPGTGTLGAVMLARRLELGMTQEDLARRIAKDGDPAFRQSDVSRLEKGKVGLPRRDRLERIARALGLPPGELLVRSGWAGAADALPAVAEVAASALDPEVVATPRSVNPRSAASPDARYPDLREVIERAMATRARSADILRRCEERWGRGGWGRSQSA